MRTPVGAKRAAAEQPAAMEREMRESEFWDHHVPSLEDCVLQYEAGPDKDTAAMLSAVEPLAGHTVLDFACGAGLTSAWLSKRGAVVTGIDLSAASTDRAAQLCEHVGAKAEFVTGALGSAELSTRMFDRIVGRFALHHVDCCSFAPILARHLRPGGVAAFLETMDNNPLLRVARKHLVGRFGIPRLGTLDEHPLTRNDLRVLENSFGELRIEVQQMKFLRIFDRQVLKYRSSRASRLLGAVDDLLQAKLRLDSWSYHQVLVLTRRTQATE